MFGFGQSAGARRGPQRGEDMRGDVVITLEEVMTGVTKRLSVERTETCAVCHGEGAESPADTEVCRECRGAGQVRENFLGSAFVRLRPCPRCHGRGRVILRPCRACRGQGAVRATRQVSVTIPAGVESGTRVRVQREGAAGAMGGPPGDLYVFVHVKEHPRFQRDHADLLGTLPVGFAQAALGAEVEYQSLDGSLTVRVPAGTQSGEWLTLPDRGLPRLGRPGRGALRLQVVLQVPKKLSPDEQKLLRQWADLRGESVGPGGRGLFHRMRDALG
jgi:molecular chaperone DnaJ